MHDLLPEGATPDMARIAGSCKGDGYPQSVRYPQGSMVVRGNPVAGGASPGGPSWRSSIPLRRPTVHVEGDTWHELFDAFSDCASHVETSPV